MKATPTEDALFGKGMIDETGRKRHDAYLFEVKKPSESKYPGDFYNLKAAIPAKDAFRHRLVLSYQALAEGVTADAILDRVLAEVPAPEVELARPPVA